MDDLELRVRKLEAAVRKKTKESDDKKSGVIRKVGNKWKILKKNRKDYWDADFDTEEDAKAALRAYWANKRECFNKHDVSENFITGLGKDLIKSIHSFLVKIFGPTLYFDHLTKTSVDLFYKGKPVAELLYKDVTDEVVVIPDDTNIAPVSFYETSEYEIKDYLSDLLLGDIDPKYA